jgi:hypothetical protein
LYPSFPLVVVESGTNCVAVQVVVDVEVVVNVVVVASLVVVSLKFDVRIQKPEI